MPRVRLLGCGTISYEVIARAPFRWHFCARTVFFTSAAPGAALGRYILQGTGKPVMGDDCFGDTARWRG